jgi:hypothetical protein
VTAPVAGEETGLGPVSKGGTSDLLARRIMDGGEGDFEAAMMLWVLPQG